MKKNNIKNEILKNELALEKKCKLLALKNKIIFIKIPNESISGRPHPLAMPGAPDAILVYPNGKIQFVEFKSKNGKLSSKQRILFSILENYNINVKIIRNENEFLELITTKTE